MVLWYNVHSTDSGSLILGSSEDDEVIQEGLLRLRSVFSTVSCTADFVKPKSLRPAASQRVPSDASLRYPPLRAEAGARQGRPPAGPSAGLPRAVPERCSAARPPSRGRGPGPSPAARPRRRMRGAGARSCRRRGAASPREAAGPHPRGRYPRGRLGAGGSPQAPPRPLGGRCPGEGLGREAPLPQEAPPGAARSRQGGRAVGRFTSPPARLGPSAAGPRPTSAGRAGGLLRPGRPWGGSPGSGFSCRPASRREGAAAPAAPLSSVKPAAWLPGTRGGARVVPGAGIYGGRDPSRFLFGRREDVGVGTLEVLGR